MKKLNQMQYRYHIAIAVAFLLLAACSTSEKLYNKAKGKNPVKVAQLCSTDWPCITTAADTVNTKDTLYDFIEVQCPDSVQYVIDSFETTTAVRVPVYVKVQQPRIVETKTVTLRIKDSADVFIIQDKLTKADKSNYDLSKKVKSKNKKILWLLIALCISVAWNFRKLLFRL